VVMQRGLLHFERPFEKFESPFRSLKHLLLRLSELFKPLLGRTRSRGRC